MNRISALSALAAAPLLALSLTACGPSANAEACEAYAQAHADLDNAVDQQSAGEISQAEMRDKFGELPGDIASAAELAEGEVKSLMTESSSAAEKYEALQTEDNGMYFFLQANRVVDACSDDGVDVSI